jgi:hypothetical protein
LAGHRRPRDKKDEKHQPAAMNRHISIRRGSI